MIPTLETIHWLARISEPSTVFISYGWIETIYLPATFTIVTLHLAFAYVIYTDVSENMGFSSKSSILIGFSIIFTIHFGVPPF